MLPVFSAAIDTSVALVVATQKQWTLPAPDPAPFSMRAQDPIVATIPNDISTFLTFDVTTRTFTWSNNVNAMHTVENKTFKVQIALYNELSETTSYEQELTFTVPVIPAYFSEAIDNSIVLTAGVASNWTMPQPEASPFAMRATDPMVVTIPS